MRRESFSCPFLLCASVEHLSNISRDNEAELGGGVRIRQAAILSTYANGGEAIIYSVARGGHGPRGRLSRARRSGGEEDEKKELGHGGA